MARATRQSAKAGAALIAKIAAAEDLVDEMETDGETTIAVLDSDEEEEDEDDDEVVLVPQKRQAVSDSDGDSDDDEEEEELEPDEPEYDTSTLKAKKGKTAGKKAGSTKARKAKRRKSNDSDSDDPDSTPPPRKIEYKIGVYTADQMKAKKTSRGPPDTDIVILQSDRAWSALKSKVISQISAVLGCDSPTLSDYNIVFTVPQKSTDPLRFDESKYEYMVEKALLIKATPTVKITVEPKPSPSTSAKENSETASDAKKKKTKVPNARDILPANEALNAKMGELRERWKCPTPGGACGSENCFYTATEPEHFPLSHTHIRSWGEAMVSRQYTYLCALINFPSDFLTGVRGVAPPIPGPAANETPMLIPYGRIAGEEVSINMFCLDYGLDDDIAARLTENKFKRTGALAFVTLDDLKQMGFAHGEIAELKVAVTKWSKLPGEV
ncbi:hypothetical protein FB45DRAFT_1042644 [Roridomyces roridus]|uniref:SAM domain-containing protein n=1 Tax=Roridomyces roridus TaxID=1738132 RepID=A0AAD7AZD8_9AGAR|nr:hypothetical protein FB45DRAFT_1042644 [Roridomyces roridus]